MKCTMCFAREANAYVELPDLATGEVLPVAAVCRGCRFQVDRLAGFLEVQGYKLAVQGLVPDDQQSVPKPSGRGASKKPAEQGGSAEGGSAARTDTP